MVGLRREEVWASQMIAAHLGVDVLAHDDGSEPSMYDLKIEANGRLFAAIEVTSDVDEAAVELLRAAKGCKRWVLPDVAGGWLVCLKPEARFRRLRENLPGILSEWETRGITRVRCSDPEDDENQFIALAAQLGVTYASRSSKNLPGFVDFMIERPTDRVSGFAKTAASAVVPWISIFLNEPKQRDVRDKLSRSNAPERHAFVLVPPLTAAPFGVTESLLADGAGIPGDPPNLPSEITHVWVTSMWASGHGLRWCPIQGWSAFSKLQSDDVG